MAGLLSVPCPLPSWVSGQRSLANFDAYFWTLQLPLASYKCTPPPPLPLLLTGVWVQWKLETGEARWGLRDTALPHRLSHPTECPWGIQRAVKGELEGLVGIRAGWSALAGWLIYG